MVPLHTNTGRAIHRLKGHMGAVTAVMYRKRYNQVISTGKDGMIFLWDASVSDALDDERMELVARFNARWVCQQYRNDVLLFSISCFIFVHQTFSML